MSACRRHVAAGLPRPLAAATAAALTLSLAACGDTAQTVSNTVTVAGDVPIAYVMRANTITMNPTNGAPSADGGDLMIREKSSSSAPEHNVTAQFTQGHGDVSDPEASYDGKKLVFAMRCPSANGVLVNGVAACTDHWNIWEYDMSAGDLAGGSFRRITSSNDDDVDPAYLPAGRGFVFSSNRQGTTKSKQAVGPAGGYYALDEYERERVFNLHTMDANGGAITQISVNQSHDRNPVVRPNGDIMFSRWDHVGGRNHFKVFRVKPDGTDMFVLYGAHSEGNSFLHPRDMDPNGPHKGFVASDLMPLSRTQEGGALVFIDAANYSEQNTPANSSVPPVGGQVQATSIPLNLGGGLSNNGRITTPYPLWDGSDRVLLAYRPCEVSRAGVVVSCTTLSAEEKARLSDEMRLNVDIAADSLQNNVPPSYAIYMFDPATQTFLIVAAPPPGFMYTDPIALQPRAEPNATDPTAPDAALAAQGMGLLEVRSVYDTDGLGRMGDAMLAAADLPSGCSSAIAKTSPADPLDTRAQVADLVRMKDPADAAYRCSPARFVRAVRAVAPPSGSIGMRFAIGQSDFEPQQILGYAPIEPDGSFKLQVPADTPIALAVIDAQGRAFQTHTNWIQVRPGERRTCDGCHSPRRGGAINSGAVVNTMPAALKTALSAAHQSGETMASTRARLDASALNLQPQMVYADLWADTTRTGVTARPSISLRYTGNPLATDDLATPAPANGLINYPEHIQPLWTRDRGAKTCTNCHTDPTRLDLSATIAGTGRVASYEALMLGKPVIDAMTGLPTIVVEEGVPVVKRDAALVDATASEGDATGMARKSRLVEILAGQQLMASAEALAKHPSPPNTAPNHSTMLNPAEKRLVAEWIDLGGKYYNNPFSSGANVRTVSTLSQDSFSTQVYPILKASCGMSCHQAVGSDQKTSTGVTFRENRFVLTGSTEGDYNVTLTMISDTCHAANNDLLSRPSSVPHPAGAQATQSTAVLPVGSANYNRIASWISSGCPTP